VSASPETKPGLVAGLFVFVAMNSAGAEPKCRSNPGQSSPRTEPQRNQSVGAALVCVPFSRRMQLSRAVTRA
jgi:hypothetical protein